MFYFDAHCHILPDNQFMKSREKGISYFVCNGTSPADWDEICRIASNVCGIYPCIGIHPWYIEGLKKDWRLTMQWLLNKYPGMMIGEIGLDGTRPDIAYQAEIFETCLKTARQFQRPVHIHGYKAWNFIIDILKCYPDLTCLFHRFSGSESQVKQLLKINRAYFSVMTVKPIAHIPAERLLIETDSPDGLHKPIRVIELANRFNLSWEQLDQNFIDFVGDLSPINGIHPRDAQKNVAYAERNEA